MPNNRFTVRVTDESTGKPIHNARVRVSSKYGKQADYKQVETRRTAEDGIARLPPLRSGSSEVRAEAEGYQASSVAPFIVDDEARERQMEISLTPVRDHPALKILDAGGAPAMGAELRLIAGANDDRPLWQATYDSPDGAEIPIVCENGLLLVRHRGSASRVVAMGRSLEPLIRLEAEAPPLVVRTQTAGGEPAPFARSAMWFGPYRMTTMSLGFLTWSQSGVASQEGVWIARGLPRSDTRIFAWRGNTGTALAGAFDALATAIAYPWIDGLTLRAVD